MSAYDGATRKFWDGPFTTWLHFAKIMKFARNHRRKQINGLGCANYTCEKAASAMPVYGYARVSTDGQTLDAQIAQLKAAGSDGWADTTTPHGRLMLTVLGGLAEFEKELIRARTSEGRERAKARGVRLGRKPKLTAHQRQEALTRREDGEPLAEIARSYDVHHSTISRLQRRLSRG